jgi:hypothetical protein
LNGLVAPAATTWRHSSRTDQHDPGTAPRRAVAAVAPSINPCGSLRDPGRVTFLLARIAVPLAGSGGRAPLRLSTKTPKKDLKGSHRFCSELSLRRDLDEPQRWLAERAE